MLLNISVFKRGFIFLLLLAGVAGGPMAAARPINPPLIQSRAALVIDQGSGQILLEKNSRQAFPIASLSKMMTAVVVLDKKQRLEDKLKVTNADRDMLKKTYSRLTIGSVLSRRDMLHIALMSSENRAASALSRNYPGGQKAFIRSMNQKARQLGMKQTRFSDPTGLTPRNVASAADLSRLMSYAFRYPLLRDFSTDKTYTVFPGGAPLVYRSSNGLISNPTWNIQLQKTGYTDQAGHCLLIRTTVGRHSYLLVLLGGRSPHAHYSDAINIKNYLSHLS